MKVSYIECDICKKKIKGEQYRYSTLYSIPHPYDPIMHGEIAYDTKMDICKSCMDKFKKWLSDATKEAKDGPST